MGKSSRVYHCASISYGYTYGTGSTRFRNQAGFYFRHALQYDRVQDEIIESPFDAPNTSSIAGTATSLIDRCLTGTSYCRYQIQRTTGVAS